MASKQKPEVWPPAEQFADRLARLRRARDYSNAQIAESCGVHPNTVSNWNGEQKPEGMPLLKLAKLFDVTPEWLLEGVTESYPPAKQSRSTKLKEPPKTRFNG